MNAEMPTTPSWPTAATSVEAPFSRMWSRDTTLVVGK
jgi:hypothetical protein